MPRPGPLSGLDEAPRSWRQWKVGGGILAAALVGVLVVVLTGALRRPNIQMPAQIAGMSRLDTPAAADFQTRMDELARAHGFDATTGVYSGDSITPSFLVLVVDATPSEGPQRAFHEFADAFATSAGQSAAIDTSQITEVSQDGASFECAPGSGRLHGSICQWDDGSTVGYVLSVDQSVDETVNLSAVVRNAVVS